MSQVKISGNASGTGVLTIAAPNTNTDRTINIPDTAGDIVTTGDSGTISASMLDGGQTGSAPIFGLRAWVSFDGTGTPSILASGNVSSVTDVAVGSFNVTFTTAMPDSNYVVTGSHIYDTTADNGQMVFGASLLTTYARVKSGYVTSLGGSVGGVDSVRTWVIFVR